MLRLHLLLPLAGAFAFLAYFSVSRWSAETKIGAYLEFLSAAFPFLIGLMTGLAAGQEDQAGEFQVMLNGSRFRASAYFGKLFSLLLPAAGSVLLAVGVFAAGFGTLPWGFYGQAAGLLYAGSLFLYILHFYVAFRFGKSACMGLGLAGVLISALMLTGLGDGIWQWFPWAWSVRFCDLLVAMAFHLSSSALLTAELRRGLWIMVPSVCAAAAAGLIWFQYWEGKKSDE
jgi:lantibiotic protection ABC transporter permease subunit, MutG family